MSVLFRRKTILNENITLKNRICICYLQMFYVIKIIFANTLVIFSVGYSGGHQICWEGKQNIIILSRFKAEGKLVFGSGLGCCKASLRPRLGLASLGHVATMLFPSNNHFSTAAADLWFSTPARFEHSCINVTLRAIII